MNPAASLAFYALRYSRAAAQFSAARQPKNAAAARLMASRIRNVLAMLKAQS